MQIVHKNSELNRSENENTWIFMKRQQLTASVGNLCHPTHPLWYRPTTEEDGSYNNIINNINPYGVEMNIPLQAIRFHDPRNIFELAPEIIFLFRILFTPVNKENKVCSIHWDIMGGKRWFIIICMILCFNTHTLWVANE